jgi:hypothetical protein
MRKALSYLLAGLVGLLFGMPFVAGAVAAFPVATGGTGQVSFPAGIIMSTGGTSALVSSSSPTVGYIWATSTTATSSFANGIALTKGCFQMPSGTCLGAGGSGTITSISFTTGLAGGTITANGTVNLLSYIATATAETRGQLAYWGTTAGTPATLNSVATTTLAGGGPITVSNTPSVIGTSGAVLGCTNASNGVTGCMTASDWGLLHTATTTFSSPLSYSLVSNAVTCPTCFTGTAPATSTFAAGTGLKVVTNSSSIVYNMLSYLSTSSAETSGQVPFWTSSNGTPANLSGGNSNFTFSSTVGTLLTATNASTTNLTAGTSLGIPNGASPTLTSVGDVAVNSTAASSSLQYYDGAAQGKLFNVTELGFTFINTPTNGQGTTTIIHGGAPRGFTIKSASCFSIGGTADVQLGSGSASTTMIKSVTSPTAQASTAISSNNAFQSLQPFYVDLGTFSASGTTTVSCIYGRQYDY